MSKKKLPKKQLSGVKRIYSVLLKSLIFMALTLLITFSYLAILISVESKSFPFVNQKIESYVNSNLLSEGAHIVIGKTFIKLKKLHKINIILDDIKLSTESKKEILLPKMESEFSLFNLMFLNFTPSKIKIIEPIIEIENGDKNTPRIAINGVEGSDVLNQEYFKKIWQFFFSLKNGSALRSFELENAQIKFISQSKTHNILVKNSSFRATFKGGSLRFDFINKINLNPKEVDLEIASRCKFKKSEDLNCDVYLSNIDPSSLGALDDRLSFLKNINAQINGNLNLEVNKDYQLSTASFNFSSASGNFYYPQFFKKKMEFKNFVISGQFDNNSKIFNIANLSTNFDNTALSLSALMTDFLDGTKQKTELQIKISKAPTNDLDKFWPVFLSDHNIRSWVVHHIKDGMIKDAYTKMTLQKSGNSEHLQKIEAEVIFSGLTLNYSDHFPKISDIEGIASFSEKNMRIDLISGKVLENQIKSATITIPDFSARELTLNIEGKTSGAAADSLKHIDYKSNFAKEIEAYFNGSAETSLNIKIPLSKTINLSGTYIEVTSDIKNFNNDYITKDSSLKVNTVKKTGNNDFVTNIDLTGANLDLKPFGISKKSGNPSKIFTILSFDKENHIALKKIDWNENNLKISGNLLLKISPILVMEINLKNSSFGRNNFSLNYNIDEKNLARNLRLKGKSLDLSSFIANPPDLGNNQQINFRKNNIQIDLDKIYLANNQIFKNTDISLNCTNAICLNSFIRSDLGGGSANISISKFKNDNYSTINGRITDVSLISKALDISNKIERGDAKIVGKIELVNNEPTISGKLEIDSKFIILRNELVEKISNTNIFTDIKDKIVGNNLKFENLELEFQIQNNILDIKKLIANSNYMGITAKGKINFDSNETQIKGLIVPGYVLNKLFGIGKIPVLGDIIVGGEGGGLFAAKYEFTKNKDDKEGQFKINEASAAIPGGIRNIFDLF